ncbi:MAG: sigma-70 family RNA polymerase sigma factor, partial [Candidatus Kapaibacterium sp.]
MTQPTDADLIQRTLSGEEAAFAELIRRYERRVIVTIKGVIHDLQREELEDIAQEIFLLLFRSLPSFRGDAQFSTYLTRIALRHCWRVAKRRRKRFGTFTSLDVEDERGGNRLRDRTPADGSADDDMLAEERREAVRRGLKLLPEEFRTVLVMRIVEEL